MENGQEYEPKKLTKYLVFAFGLAWVLQIAASLLVRNGLQGFFSPLLLVVMFMPLLAVVLSGFSLKTLGWTVRFQGRVRYFLMAWLLPAVLSILGAALYFAVFPERFDRTGEAIIAAYGETVTRQLEATGLSYPALVVTAAVSACVFAPWINMLAAIGEESGWRGVMSPQLILRFGKTKGLLLSGLIWGVWHWPVMFLAGYEYGMSYFGAPFLGMALFCLFTTAMGILLAFVYEKTGCIWAPALMHGAVNATGGIGANVLVPDYTDQMILGPAQIGIVAMVPLLLAAAWVLFSGRREK